MTGDKELRKAFEDVTTNNVKTILDYAKETRALLRNIETRCDHLDAVIQNQNVAIDNLRMQLAAVQAKIYQGGTV